MHKPSLLLAAFVSAAAASRAFAQTPATPSGTTLITLGTRGGPLPTPDRAQSSNLLVVNGALYLIDGGGAVTMRIVQADEAKTYYAGPITLAKDLMKF